MMTNHSSQYTSKNGSKTTPCSLMGCHPTWYCNPEDLSFNCCKHLKCHTLATHDYESLKASTMSSMLKVTVINKNEYLPENMIFLGLSHYSSLLVHQVLCQSTFHLQTWYCQYKRQHHGHLSQSPQLADSTAPIFQPYLQNNAYSWCLQ